MLNRSGSISFLTDITTSANRRSRSRSFSPPPSSKRSRRSASPNNHSRQRSYSRSRSRSRSPPRKKGPNLQPEIEKFIRTVAGKVKDLGPEFENHLREKEKENPKFQFLKDEMVSWAFFSFELGIWGRGEEKRRVEVQRLTLSLLSCPSFERSQLPEFHFFRSLIDPSYRPPPPAPLPFIDEVRFRFPFLPPSTRRFFTKLISFFFCFFLFFRATTPSTQLTQRRRRNENGPGRELLGSWLVDGSRVASED